MQLQRSVETVKLPGAHRKKPNVCRDFLTLIVVGHEAVHFTVSVLRVTLLFSSKSSVLNSMSNRKDFCTLPVLQFHYSIKNLKRHKETMEILWKFTVIMRMNRLD